MGNTTFAIIKPDAVKNKSTGKIYNHIIQSGFNISAAKLINMSSSFSSELIMMSKHYKFSVTTIIVLAIITILSIFLFVGQIGSFDLIYGLTKGGPGISTQILAMQIFQDGMLFFKFGLAAAESVILLFIVIIFSLLGLKLYSIAEFKT